MSRQSGLHEEFSDWLGGRRIGANDDPPRDLALHAAKDGGRGQYRFYSNDLKDRAQERRGIEEDLRGALARGELQMHYQPIVRAADNKVTGFEALMRWEHPERGAISPGVFIPIAEESNLIG